MPFSLNSYSKIDLICDSQLVVSPQMPHNTRYFIQNVLSFFYIQVMNNNIDFPTCKTLKLNGIKRVEALSGVHHGGHQTQIL